MEIYYKNKKYYVSDNDYNDKNNIKLFLYKDKALKNVVKINGKTLMVNKDDLTDKLKENYIKTFEEYHGINEGTDLKKYTAKEYKDYEYGDPIDSVKGLLKLIEKFKKEAQTELDKAGSFLSPAIKVAFEKEMMQAIREIQAN
jgi:hypothetical protein